MNARSLLETAKRMPEASDLLAHLSELRELMVTALRLPLDRDRFVSEALRAWTRSSIDGFTLDDVALASVVGAASYLTLTHEQRKTLRADVASVNRRLLEAIRAEQ